MTIAEMPGKWSQTMNDARQRWTKLTEHDLVQAKGNVQEMISLLQERYGYTREQAEREVDQFLDQYDARVLGVARSLPGDVPSKVMRRPWATIATMLGVGVALGLISRPGCNDGKHVRIDTTAD